MAQVKAIVAAKNGVHARPAGLVAKEAAKFNSDINIIKDDRTVNAKSIMNLMTAGLQYNDEVIIEANGDDADQAVAAIKALFDNAFGE